MYSTMCRTVFQIFAFIILIVLCNKGISQSLKKTAYYFSVTGNDKNDGTEKYPLKTIKYLNTLTLDAGDTILLKGGDIFKGNITLEINISDASKSPVTLISYGRGIATIDAGNNFAITINRSSFINIKNIICKGAGRNNGNTKNGICINESNHINIVNADISGFQKAGLLIYKSANIEAGHIYAHGNGFAGISVCGENKKDDCANVHINHCTAENNPGDPTNFNNHSGNGIIAGFCKNVLIEYCTATNNGWDMPRTGNGPVGIWCYEADSVIIQHCISYKNKTSKNGEDGGGYDLDGGTTNSIIQYCLSYENQGSAFGIFQYAGASAWYNNTVRFCISENDGSISAAHANAYIWNSSHDATQFKDFLFYNNTIYNNSNAAISYSVESEHSNFRFYNNIFVAANELIKGSYAADIFLANDWWSLKKKFYVDGIYNFKNWCVKKNKEQLNKEIKGINVKPLFKNAGNAKLVTATGLINFNNYKLIQSSSDTQAGIDLQALFNINIGSEDFNGKLLNKNFLGACHH